MAYRLKAGESIPEGIRRVVLEEIDSAAGQLGRKSGNRGEAIHEARKSIKKIRGALRLVQPELGRIYKRENTRLRDLGHKLSEIRDAEAIIEVFDDLVAKYNDELQRNGLASIRVGLRKSKSEIEQAVNLDETALRGISTLRAARKRVPSWPLKADGFTAIEGGLRNRYRRGRQAMATAKKDPTPENFHEWRKRVKDHWYHVRLLESLWTEVMQAHEESLKKLETWLGDDHNLTVLCGKLRDNPDNYGSAEEVRLSLALAAQYQKELREKAQSLGQRIYEEKPRQFARNMSKLWDAWHSQPDSMKEDQKGVRRAARKSPAKATAGKSKRSAA